MPPPNPPDDYPNPTEQGDVVASEVCGNLDNPILMAEIESDLNHIFAEFDRVIDLLIPKGGGHAPTQPS